ncbi:MAG: hypothetical protein M1608_17055 [Candidatus Omnitrophica bacterium]|nr:hypothetical protein [Candidatus Omnitrophota bacterium]
MLSDTNKPVRAMRLMFIHHSSGEAWLADWHGGLGVALRDSNYYVSDSNYGWGPDGIGDTTDIGYWWNWFRGPESLRYMEAVYAESGQNCEYSRGDTAPEGENEIIMFKSCFPNSALKGDPGDPVPGIADNPLRGQEAGSEYHTVANAKGIYMDLLNYFGAMTNKLFVAVTAPPLSDPAYANNARAFNQWLVNEWLADYPFHNVFVWDFYNVLTSNGGTPEANDLNLETGNHHRWWNGAAQHKTDDGGNVSAYPSAPDNDHPNQAGDLKATAEFVPLLNAAVHAWLVERAGAPGFSAVYVGDQQVGLTITNLSVGITYVIQRCPDLKAGTWNDAHTFVSQSAVTNWFEPLNPEWVGIFYRVKWGQ